ncbi:undecaprenyl-diphosphate phosphatase [Cerasicoccus arenae]|uniref:Undecaprenyl-diphosphatase n=1 Tax=Cerasicoccus arenae TaxID=424488 RepID=A0A8J3DDD9_9BACT|nr:undecaprenyl-diphosphate phosphatase [Cerasicoccus arenae]MBK1857884.1 undecaprenyl-diphosphate phosphatase [Cerasicoccus arenae]GHC09451.1 undecaprenyl-diphosphatase [Cerasicoccus arenae]
MNKALLFILALLLSASLYGETEAEVQAPEMMPKSEISYIDALILGLVEGITEYLPISSTGHLLITNDLLGLNTQTVLTDNLGQPILRDDSEPLTLENVANAYAIIIQFGAIMAVVLLYWSRLIDMLRGVLGQSRTGLLLTRNLFTAFLPAAFIGLLLDDWIEQKLFHTIPIVIALIAGAILMLAVEARRSRRPKAMEDASPDLHELTLKQSLTVGFLQCIAMWPGTSRSMMTIVGGYVIGLTPKRAAEFSFLLGLITLTAASAYKALTMGPVMLKALSPGPALFGIIVAWASAMLAVKWLVAYLSKHGLALFAWYRIVLAVAVLIYLYT